MTLVWQGNQLIAFIYNTNGREEGGGGYFKKYFVYVSEVSAHGGQDSEESKSTGISHMHAFQKNINK